MQPVPPGWTSAVGAPHSRTDRRIVAGAALTFVGFLIQGIVGIVSFLFFNPFGSGFGLFIVFNIVNGIGSILIAVGLLIAFLGIAARLR